MGNQWLINTPANVATLTYDQQDTATWITVPYQTLWANVLKGTVLRIEDFALYYFFSDTYNTKLEISPFLKQHFFELDPTLKQHIQYEGTQTIDFIQWLSAEVGECRYNQAMLIICYSEHHIDNSKDE